jgi:hypothetical protein
MFELYSAMESNFRLHRRQLSSRGMWRRVGLFYSGLLACSWLLTGCQSKPPIIPPPEPAQSAVISEFQSVAEDTLGKQSIVVAHGDLAKSGSEQLLVVDRTGTAARPGNAPDGRSPIAINRAAILEKTGDKWVELLRCDEHLKNSHGYLQGAPVSPVTGWKLKFEVSDSRGLDMLFTPSDEPIERGHASNQDTSGGRPVEVRWNKNTRRYQSLDASGAEFLDETPALEIQHSILK